MHHHGVTFNFGSAKVCSSATFDAYFSYYKGIWIAAIDYDMVLLIKCGISIDSYTPN